MTANHNLNSILVGLVQWVSIFGSIVGIVLLVALSVSLITSGISGPKSILKTLFQGKVARIGGSIGAILGLLSGGWLGWMTGPQAVFQFNSVFNFNLDIGSGPVLGAVVCGLLGLFIGPATCAAVFDSLHISPRRIWALSILTIKESWARKLIWILVNFVVLFMFAAWFLPQNDFRADLQVKNYISTALFPITWLPLLVAVLLSCWGLPEDIKNRSIHTVVTKPVRRTEILIGRILGFTCVGTFLLVVMGAVGYAWIMRQVPAEAEDRLICRVPIQGNLHFTDRSGKLAPHGINVGDEDLSREYIEGGTSAVAIWTFNNISPETLGESFLFETRFRAFRLHKGNMKRTLMGQIRFVKKLRQRTAYAIGLTTEFKEVSQHIENGAFSEAGNTLAALADGLEKQQILLSESSYETLFFGYRQLAQLLGPLQTPDSPWLADLVTTSQKISEAAVATERRQSQVAAPLKQVAKLFLENAEELQVLITNTVADHDVFEVREFGENVIEVDQKISYRVGDDQQQQEGSLLENLVHGDELQVEVICLDTGQFLGMAQPDLFIRATDNRFIVGFIKTVLGIWLMMTLVIVFGVTASCFVKGPVATLLILSLLTVGSGFHDTLERIVQGDMKGGGALETARRIVEHLNPQTNLVDTTATQLMRSADSTLTGGLWLVHKIVPDFNTFWMSHWIADGFDVPMFGDEAALIPGILMTLAYLLPCLLIGSYSLKLRELESK